MSTVIKYIIIILISILVGWNIRISIDDNSCKNGICPAPQEYRESDSNGKNNKWGAIWKNKKH